MSARDRAVEWRRRNIPLSACPFCGHAGAPWLGHRSEIVTELKDDDAENFAVVCGICAPPGSLYIIYPPGCGATTGYHRSPEAAYRAWERRARFWWRVWRPFRVGKWR